MASKHLPRRAKTKGGLEKCLANPGSRQKITKTTHAVRGLQTKWEIQDYCVSCNICCGSFNALFGRMTIFPTHAKAQPGLISSSSDGNGACASNFLSAKIPIIAALSVQSDFSANRKVKPFRAQAFSISANTNSTVVFQDAPSVVLYNGNAQENLAFSNYLMLKPAGGIWVPLRLVTWTLNDESLNFTVEGGGIITGDAGSTNFPDWKNTFHN